MFNIQVLRQVGEVVLAIQQQKQQASLAERLLPNVNPTERQPRLAMWADVEDEVRGGGRRVKVMDPLQTRPKPKTPTRVSVMYVTLCQQTSTGVVVMGV